MEKEKNKKSVYEEEEKQGFHLSYATWVLFILIILLCLIFSFSFIFQKPKQLQPSHKTEIDLLEVSMDDGGNGVVVNEMLPVLDENVSTVPVYQFTVKNPTSEKVTYQLYLKDLDVSEIQDGCHQEDLLKRDQLRYQFMLNDKQLALEDVVQLENSSLGHFTVEPNETQKFSLRIFVPESKKATDWAKKHYHYKIVIQSEEEEK